MPRPPRLPPPIPADNGSAFNSTVWVTLNWTTPLLSLWYDFKIDPATGYRVRSGPSSAASDLYFVGVGFGINGTIARRYDDTPPKPEDDHLGGVSLFTIDNGDPYTRLRNQSLARHNPNLGFMSDLNVSAYTVHLGFGASTKEEVRNVTIQLPVKTQA